LEAGLVGARDLGRRDARGGAGARGEALRLVVRRRGARRLRPGALAGCRQEAAQTFVSQFVPAPKRKTADYYALTLADTVYGGGGFGTRLNLNLREDKGYSYGVFSSLALFDDAGVWYSAGGVQTNKTKESVVEFDRELKGMTGRPLSDAEFA